MKIKVPKAKQLAGWVKKYKYPLLILLLGLVLVLIPGKKKQSASEYPVSEVQELPATAPEEEDYCEKIRQELETILSQVHGAGKVKVMLTLSEGKRKIYQTDFETSSQQGGEESVNASTHNTVILSRGSSYDEPAVVTESYPVFQGALILSEGADDASVRLDLINAVSALLHLSSDKITVVKMK